MKTKQALTKLAQVRLAINYVLRDRMVKQAGWFKKKYENPDWYNDEDAVTQFVLDKTPWGPFKHTDIAPEAEAVYKNDISKAHEAINRFNAMLRVNRHSDRSAALLDRYFDLWGDNIDPTLKPLMYKGDRYDSLNELADDLWDNSMFIPEEKQEAAQQLWNDTLAYLDEYTRARTKNPSKDVYFDVSEESLKEPLTRKDVGSLEDATPKQVEKWKQDSKKSVVWATLWPILLGAGLGAGAGSFITDSQGINGALPLGAMGGLLGSIPGLLHGENTYRKKNYAKKRLNEK